MISTPNAEVYQDVATGSNPSHVKQLDAGKFCAIVSEHFSNCRLFGQRSVIGPPIVPDSSSASATDWYETFRAEDTGGYSVQEGIGLPTHFIAVASETALPEIRQGLLDDQPFLRDLYNLLEKRAIGIRETAQLLRATIINRDVLHHHLRSRESELGEVPSVHLVAVQSFGIGDPRPFGFDAAVEFPPHNPRFLIDPRTFPGVDPTFDGSLEDYRKVVADQLAKPLPKYTLHRGVMPSWDNTPRRKKRAHILLHSSPTTYQVWLRRVTAQTAADAEARAPFIFANALNYWTEGAILEPDSHHGYRYLEATRAGLSQGLADYLRARGIRIEEPAISNLLMPNKEEK